MKLSALMITAAAVAALCGGTALAQVTMQPVPNPPEKAKPAKSKHHAKHSAKSEAKSDSTATDTKAPDAK